MARDVSALAMFIFFYLVFPSTLLPDHVKVSAVNRGEGKVRRADVLEIKITIGTDENNNEDNDGMEWYFCRQDYPLMIF